LLVLLSSGVPGASAQSADIAFNAYIGIPLNGKNTFFGASCGTESAVSAKGDNSFSVMPPLTFDLRYSGDRGAVLSFNGVPFSHALVRRSSGGSADEGSDTNNKEVDWMAVAAVVVGAGLIALVATADDSRVQICSGVDCPPPEKPPAPEPKPDAPSEAP
jgi:hypothetical protein